MSICPVCSSEGKYKFSSRDLMFDGDKSYNYHQCLTCELVYQHPMPLAEEIPDFYPPSYSIYSKPSHTEYSQRKLAHLKKAKGYGHINVRISTGLKRYLRPCKAVPEVVDWVPNGKLLDIGCGNGEYLLRLQSLGWDCQGVEFNDKAVSICRSHGLNIFHGDLKTAGFRTDSFDFVTAHHLIEHIADPRELMREIARITKPGGYVLIRTPNSRALGRRWFGVYWFANEVPRHLILFCEGSLDMLTSTCGLKLTRRYRPIKTKLILRSLDYKFGNIRVESSKWKVLSWLVNLYIPVAKIADQGDELFSIYKKL